MKLKVGVASIILCATMCVASILTWFLAEERGHAGLLILPCIILVVLGVICSLRIYQKIGFIERK